MNIFNQPFPCTTSIRIRFFSALGFGLFVFIFLLFFKPYNIGSLPEGRQVILSVTYGGITFGVLFGLSTLILLLTPGFVRDERWTTGKEILYITGYVIVIGFVNYLASPFLSDASRNWRNIFWFQARTAAIAVLPITIYVLIKQNFLLNRFKKEAEDLQKRLDEKNRGGGGQEPPSQSSDPEPLP